MLARLWPVVNETVVAVSTVDRLYALAEDQGRMHVPFVTVLPIWQDQCTALPNT